MRLPGPEVEDELEDDTAGLPRSNWLVYTIQERTTVLLDASARRGGPVAVMAVDGGNELRLVAACDQQRRGRSRERGEVRGDRGGSRGDVQDVGDADRLAGGGARVARRRRARARRPLGRSLRMMALVGWANSARPGSWTARWAQLGCSEAGLTAVAGRQVRFSFLYFISCFIFFCNFVAFLKMLRHFQKSPNCSCPLFSI